MPRPAVRSSSTQWQRRRTRGCSITTRTTSPPKTLRRSAMTIPTGARQPAPWTCPQPPNFHRSPRTSNCFFGTHPAKGRRQSCFPRRKNKWVSECVSRFVYLDKRASSCSLTKWRRIVELHRQLQRVLVLSPLQAHGPAQSRRPSGDHQGAIKKPTKETIKEAH